MSARLVRVEIVDQRWRLTIGADTHDLASLADLVEALKTI